MSYAGRPGSIGVKEVWVGYHNVWRRVPVVEGARGPIGSLEPRQACLSSSVGFAVLAAWVAAWCSILALAFWVWRDLRRRVHS